VDRFGDIDFDSRISLVLVESSKDALKPLGRVIRVEAVTGLAAGEELALACMAADTPANWIGPIWTAEGEVTEKFMAVSFCGPMPL